MRDFFECSHGCNRERTLSYGVSCVTEDNRAVAERAYEAHASAVREYFHGPDAPPERRSRLLEVDFTDPAAGALVCEYVLTHMHAVEPGAAAARCASFGPMPHVQPADYCYSCPLPNGEAPLRLSNTPQSFASYPSWAEAGCKEGARPS